jgi:hypothetical protein
MTVVHAGMTDGDRVRSASIRSAPEDGDGPPQGRLESRLQAESGTNLTSLQRPPSEKQSPHSIYANQPEEDRNPALGEDLGHPIVRFPGVLPVGA